MATSAILREERAAVATSRAAWEAEKKKPGRTPESVDKMHRAWVTAAENHEEAMFEKWKEILPTYNSGDTAENQTKKLKKIEDTLKSNIEAIEMVQISKQKKWENPETMGLYNDKYQDLKKLTIHKENMAVGVAASVIITAGAIAAIALIMIFCPPAGLSALALGLTFGILGGAGTLGLLGITHFSTRLHVDNFAIKAFLENILFKKDYQSLKCYYQNMSLFFNEKINQRIRYKFAEAIVAPWKLPSLLKMIRDF
jgi:hypothetical protein